MPTADPEEATPGLLALTTEQLCPPSPLTRSPHLHRTLTQTLAVEATFRFDVPLNMTRTIFHTSK
ncbi:hypothetical protein V7x_52530 [Crateriforma conspicua]|uniref:Uncharacterized protein n=1 Tax=Crateriforma conspicua TaxID=2527996 RepID=A0A5C6FHH6_9PLAN|nr:hypothetical protein V7x_52530 [Crateriforma conspicua]